MRWLAVLNYNSDEVIQFSRQYNMFSNSLNLVMDSTDRTAIIKELDRLEEKIVRLTNNMYENAYNLLYNKEAYLLDDELNRLTSLIKLIKERTEYINKRRDNHYELTGKYLDIYDFVGLDIYDSLQNKVNIIKKYSDNVKNKEKLESKLNDIDNKIKLISEKININESLNRELETKMIDCLSNTFNKFNLHSLESEEDNIRFLYKELGEMVDLARDNYETAKTTSYDMVSDCKGTLSEVNRDYIEYKEKVSILDLMKIYDRKCNTYQELLDKRTSISELYDNIVNKKVKDAIGPILKSQYTTILLEGEDISNYEKLLGEKEKNTSLIKDIDEENSSEEFQSVLNKLIENENKRKAHILEEQLKEQEEENKKKQEIEKRRQEEIMKRQKLLEDTRKKEQEWRTKQLLEEQKNTVLQSNKVVDTNKVSFSNIKKDIGANNVKKEPVFNKLDEKIDDEVDNTTYGEIERDLFKEFNDNFKAKKVESKLDSNDYFPNIPV